MEQINANLSSLILQFSQAFSDNGINQVSGLSQNKIGVFQDNTAFAVAPFMGDMPNYDFVMANIATFNDVITTANDGFSLMKEHGENIRSLIEQARGGDLSEDVLNKLDEEVNAQIAEINKIKNDTSFSGIFPFQDVFSLNIPNWQDIVTAGIPVNEPEETESEISEVLASISFDMNVDGGSEFNIGASATITIGYNDDGSLQIDVDATMDFDLSDISKLGIQSDGAYDLINKFLEFITGKQNDLNNASNMLTNFFASGSASIVGDAFAIDATNDINVESENSKNLKGQIVQHASITLDSTANQCPNIAINIL